MAHKHLVSTRGTPGTVLGLMKPIEMKKPKTFAFWGLTTQQADGFMQTSFSPNSLVEVWNRSSTIYSQALWGVRVILTKEGSGLTLKNQGLHWLQDQDGIFRTGLFWAMGTASGDT